MVVQIVNSPCEELAGSSVILDCSRAPIEIESTGAMCTVVMPVEVYTRRKTDMEILRETATGTRRRRSMALASTTPLSNGENDLSVGNPNRR